MYVVDDMVRRRYSIDFRQEPSDFGDSTFGITAEVTSAKELRRSESRRQMEGKFKQFYY